MDQENKIKMVASVLSKVEDYRETISLNVLLPVIVETDKLIPVNKYMDILYYLTSVEESETVEFYGEFEKILVPEINNLIAPSLEITSLNSLRDLVNYEGPRKMTVNIVLNKISRYYGDLIDEIENVELPSYSNIFLHHTLHQALYISESLKEGEVEVDNTKELKVILGGVLEGNSNGYHRLANRNWMNVLVINNEDNVANVHFLSQKKK